MTLSIAATSKIESKLMYGKILELVQNRGFMATIHESDRQALKRLAALLEGRLSDEFGQARLTFAQLKDYLVKRGYRPARMSSLWTSVVGSGLGIYIRTDMGIDQYAVPCTLIQKMIEASPGSYHHIGASSQEILREWLESIGRLD